MLHDNESNSDTCPVVRRTVQVQGGRTLSTYRCPLSEYLLSDTNLSPMLSGLGQW